MAFYDPKNNRLVFLGNKPTSKFWDKIWKQELTKEKSKLENIDLLVVPTSKKYLKPRSKILEGGCGHGTYIASLNKAGYKCIGIDFSRETINTVKKIYPKLSIYYGDVADLKYKNDTFNGYWSLGVIEHFYNGFKPVLGEMSRVTKQGGYVFVTFPYMSPIRKLKATFGLYPKFSFKKKPKDFYQFALNHNAVISEFEKSNFKLIQKKSIDGFAGLRKEIPQLSFILEPINYYSTRNVFGAGVRFIISIIIGNFTGHTILLVFKNNKLSK